jgi:hypothetical protein
MSDQDKHPAPWKWLPVKATSELVSYQPGDPIEGLFYLYDATGTPVGPDCDCNREFRYVEARDNVARELIRLAPEMEAALRKVECSGTLPDTVGGGSCCPDCEGEQPWTKDNRYGAVVHADGCSIGDILAALDAARKATT